MHLNDYLRLPIATGAKLRRAEEATFLDQKADPKDGLYFEALLDRVNRSFIASLQNAAPGPAYLLVFSRGSLVKHRLQLAQTYWPRIVAVLDLQELFVELAQSFGQSAVDEAVFKIKKAINAKLLHDRRRLSAGKLLFRINKVEPEALIALDYSDIVRLIDALATVHSVEDDSLEAALLDAEPGKAERYLRAHLRVLLQRFAGQSLANQIEANYRRFVDIQKQAGSLFPALPIRDQAVRDTADAFDLTADEALKLIRLFRFAWLTCRLSKPKHLSDIAFKALVVTQRHGDSDTAQDAAQELLMRVYGLMEKGARTQNDLQRFREIYPGVRVTLMTNVIALPRPLFDVFVATDSNRTRFDFLMKYVAGGDYLRRFVDALFGQSKFRHRLRTDLESLISKIIYVRNGIATDGRIKRETIQPFEVGPDQCRTLIRKIIAEGNSEALEKCSWLFNEVAKQDFHNNIRGLWTVKSE